MTNYYSSIVVNPELSLVNITPLERLYLSTAFEEEIDEEDGAAAYGAPENGITNFGVIRRADLVAAIDQSRRLGCGLVSIFEGLLAGSPEGEEIEFDLDRLHVKYTDVLQAIVRRSANFKRIIVYHSYYCDRLCLDGFGGAVDLIEADRIESWSTDEQVRQWLEPAAA